MPERRPTKDPWYDKAIRWCLYSLAVAVPAVFSPEFHTVFSMPKLAVLRFITLAILALWGCKVFVEEKFTYRKSWLNILLLVYAAISVINTFYSVAFYTSLYGAEGRYLGIFTMLDLLLLPFFILNFLRDAKAVRTFIMVSVATASVLAFYGFLQYQGVFDNIFHWNQDPGDRVFGTIGHGNHFGAYLGMNLLFSIFLLPTVKKGEQRWLIEVGIFLQVMALFLTASRGALFATVVALAVCALIVGVKNRQKIGEAFRRWPARLVVLGIAMLMIFGLVTGQLAKLPFIERSIGTLQFVQQGNIPDRVSWWLSTLQMIKDRPLLGFGLSTYRDVYNTYRRTDYRAPGPDDIQDLITPEAAHNEYLNIAATQGLVGLSAFLAIILYLFWKIDDRTIFSKKIDKDFYLTVGIKGALMVYLIQVFVSFGVITTLTLFFLCIGLAAVMTQQKEHLKTLSVRGIVKYVKAVVVVFIICYCAYFTATEALAEIFYKRAEYDTFRKNLKGAIENYHEAVLMKPNEYAYHQAMADFALKNADTEGLGKDAQAKMLNLAEVSYENAAAINAHHPSVFYNLGVAEAQLYTMTKNELYFQKAVDNFERAMALAVNNPLYPYQVAKALLSVNLPQAENEAAEALNKSLQIRPGYRDAEELLAQIR